MSERYLLDTHALIWTLSAPSRLPRRVGDLIRNPANDVYFSAVNTWEIAIKSALGKIAAEVPLIVEAAREADLEELPIRVAHTIRLGLLPARHRDPFDRILVAQAIEERMILITQDRLLATYPVPTMWS